ncbi:HisA/HisF-related TIM barrel protein [Leptospira sp. 96542]|nr:HisA/HisF-related TIM barrel protein [Leptospira sp. 96542]
MAYKKRLIGSILIKDGIAVQSFSYQRYLPLGNPVILAENLDRWGVDEIVILSIDNSKCGVEPDLGLLNSIARRVNTPIAYGGGIKNLDQALGVIHSGADRIIVDQLYFNDISQINSIAESIGSQAVIISLPCSLTKGIVSHLNYRTKTLKEINPYSLPLVNQFVASEFLLVDYMNEGSSNSFTDQLVEYFPQDISLICYGGISEGNQVERLLNKQNVAAVCIGNFLNYKEHYFQNIKLEISKNFLRNPIFES